MTGRAGKTPLEPAHVARVLGPASAPAKVLVPALFGALEAPAASTERLFAEWQALFGQAVGSEAHAYPGVVDWAARLGVSLDGAGPRQIARLFFAVHTCYALAIKLVTAEVLGALRARDVGGSVTPVRGAHDRVRAGAGFTARLAEASTEERLHLLRDLESGRAFESFGVTGFLEGDLFAWYLDEHGARVGEGARELARAVGQLDPTTPLLSLSTVTDLFKELYQRLVPERIRHALGEFYTPDWLAEHTLEQVGFAGAVHGSVLDPACGSGTFLVRALQLLKARGGLSPSQLLAHVRAHGIAGFDLNPLAVLAARANLILSLAPELASTGEGMTLPVYLVDSIRTPERFLAVAREGFDFVVGNPPWVVWSQLPASYREAVKPICDRYDVFSDDGWVGGIESDISTVMVHAAADRWLRPGGALGVVITQSVFKTKSAQGFRRFRIPGGAPLRVLRVDDMASLRPFDDAANRTAVLFLRKGSETRYPVPYHVWSKRSRKHTLPGDAALSHVRSQVHIREDEALPVSGDGGAWMTGPAGRAGALLGLLGGEGLHARKGTTTDFNNVYWGAVTDVRAGEVELENGQSEQGHQVARARAWLEEELVYPLARGQDISRFAVRAPETALLLPQLGMRAFDESTMRGRFPKAFAYFSQYRDSACRGCRVGAGCRKGLVHRGSYASPKYGGAMGEYWGVWNVGPYTFQPHKVAWREVSARFEAAVLGTAALRGCSPRVHIPDHKLMFRPCATEDEAHYLCGVLNSAVVGGFAEAVSLSTSRGTRIFEALNVPPFDRETPSHSRVAGLSRAAHRGERELDEAFEVELDAAVADALGHARAEAVGLSWSPRRRGARRGSG